MKVSDYIAKFLAARHVPFVFEMSGGMIAHLLDSLCRQDGLKAVSVHHEQAAAFAAEAVARMTGIPSVAMATSGPGATNLLTGIGSCYFDSTPAVFITGQVNRHEQRGDRAIRQLGFQETDIVAMAKPITKAAWLVKTPEELPGLLEEAFRVATEGRPGPVLIDVPMDIQRAEIDVPEEIPMPVPVEGPAPDAVFVKELFEQIDAAERPLILAGGGIRSGLATGLFREFIGKLGIPVVTSLMGVDAVSYHDPLRAGMIGSYGNRWANLAMGNSDLLLVLGSRLDVRQTGSEAETFKGERQIFHVDCEPGEMNNRVVGCRVCVAELRDFFHHGVKAAAGRRFRERSAWLGEIEVLKRQWPDTRELDCGPGINPNVFMHALSAVSGEAAAYVADVGQHQMWAAQSLEIGPEQRFLTSGGMGSMGFGLPAAIGAALSVAPKPVVVVAGDGGFQSNIQELQTIVRNGLAVKIVVIDNGCHGMVRQFQESYFDGRYQSTLWGYSAPDFAKVALAYGLDARAINAQEEVEEAVRWLWRDPAKPALLQVMVDKMANAYPKLAFGRPITEMEPFSKPLAMEGT
jgi:acetolactate synthase-1/2/3 large subunit